MLENYVAFYTSTRFWVDDIPDLKAIQHDPGRYYKVMAEEVFVHSTEDYTLKVCKDGLFMVRIEPLEIELQNSKVKGQHDARIQLTGKYYDYLNAIQFLFDGVVLRDERRAVENVGLRIGDAFRITLKDGEFNSAGGGKLDGRFLGTYNLRLPPEFNSYVFGRFVTRIPKTAFEKLVVEFEKVWEDYDKVKILSQIMVAVGNYQLLNFTGSLVQCWFVIEYFINLYWVEFLADKRSGFEVYQNNEGNDTTWRKSNQKDFLTGANFTSSIMSNVLELNGIIEHSVFAKIDKIRGKRNEAVHSKSLVSRLVDKIKEASQKKKVKEISPEDCQKAFEIISYFVEKTYGVDLRISSGFSYNPL